MKRDVVKLVMVIAALITMFITVINVDKIMTISSGVLDGWILVVLFDFIILELTTVRKEDS